MIRTVMKLRLSTGTTGSVWTSDQAPSGLLRRVFARLSLRRHGPDGPAIVSPF